MFCNPVASACFLFAQIDGVAAWTTRLRISRAVVAAAAIGPPAMVVARLIGPVLGEHPFEIARRAHRRIADPAADAIMPRWGMPRLGMPSGANCVEALGGMCAVRRQR